MVRGKGGGGDAYQGALGLGSSWGHSLGRVDSALHLGEGAGGPPQAGLAHKAQATKGLPISAEILLSPAPP